MGLYLADCSPSGGTVPGDPPHAAFTGWEGWGRESLTQPGWRALGSWGPGVHPCLGHRGVGEGSQGFAWGCPGRVGGMELGSGLLCFRREGGFWNQRF